MNSNRQRRRASTFTHTYCHVICHFSIKKNSAASEELLLCLPPLSEQLALLDEGVAKGPIPLQHFKGIKARKHLGLFSDRCSEEQMFSALLCKPF